MKEQFLNVAAFEPCTKVHGPGTRFALWLQGCPLRCTGCTNPEMLDVDKEAQRVSPREVNVLIRKAMECVLPMEGITVMGGEPTSQAEALFPVLKYAQQAGLNSLVFSGFTLGQLRNRRDPAIEDLLGLTDTLIDGPYIAALQDPELIRGSTNQQIIHLTDALERRDFSRRNGEHSIQMGIGGVSVSQSGFFPGDLSPSAT